MEYVDKCAKAYIEAGGRDIDSFKIIVMDFKSETKQFQTPAERLSVMLDKLPASEALLVAEGKRNLAKLDEEL